MPLFDIAPEPQPELPPLVGSSAQIPWAEKVRAKQLAAIRKLIRDEQVLVGRGKLDCLVLERHIEAVVWIKRSTSCRYWLDRRDNTALELLDGAPARPGNDLYSEVAHGD